MKLMIQPLSVASHRLLFFGILFGLSCSFSVSAAAKSLEDRVERLEQIADNPVLLQMSRRLGELQSQIQSLQDENDRLKRQMQLLEDKQASQYKETDDRLSKITAQFESAQQQAIQPPVALTDEKLVGEVTVVAAETVMPPVIPSQMTQTDAQSAVPQQQTPDVMPSTEAEQSISAEKTTEPLPVTKEIITHPATEQERELYQSAFGLMKHGEYIQAIDAFQAFRKDFPQSSLASNVSYWSGEAYLILEKLDQALISFLDVVDFYPSSSKAPAAMLRAADTYKQMEKYDESRRMYQDLLTKYPNDRVAKKAEARLGELTQ